MTQKNQVFQDTSAAAEGSRASAVAHEVGKGLHDLGHEARDLAVGAVGQARKAGETQLASRKDRAVEVIGGLASALRQTGDHLESQNGHEVVDYVTRAADGLDRVSRYLKSRDLRNVVSDVEGFARREPAIFLGGAFVLGIVGSRFLKSSSTREAERTRRSSEENGGATGALPQGSARGAAPAGARAERPGADRPGEGSARSEAGPSTYRSSRPTPAATTTPTAKSTSGVAPPIGGSMNPTTGGGPMPPYLPQGGGTQGKP